MTLRREQKILKCQIKEAITVLSKNILEKNGWKNIAIEGTLGITINFQDVFLVNINKHIPLISEIHRESSKTDKREENQETEPITKKQKGNLTKLGTETGMVHGKNINIKMIQL